MSTGIAEVHFEIVSKCWSINLVERPWERGWCLSFQGIQEYTERSLRDFKSFSGTVMPGISAFKFKHFKEVHSTLDIRKFMGCIAERISKTLTIFKKAISKKKRWWRR